MSQLVPNTNPYCVEKLTNALCTLVVGEGDARARLGSAYASLCKLQPQDFPLAHQKKWAWIDKEAKKFGPLRDDSGQVCLGSVDHTMTRIRNSTASKIIKAIYELYWEVSENEIYR